MLVQLVSTTNKKFKFLEGEEENLTIETRVIFGKFVTSKIESIIYDHKSMKVIIIINTKNSTYIFKVL